MNDAALVWQAEEELAAAHLALDLAAFERLLHPHYVIVLPGGAVEGKRQVLDSLRSGSRRWQIARSDEPATGDSARSFPMAKDYTTLPPTHMRRSDRAVEEEAWIKAFLQRAAWGVMATSHEGQPFINSNLFVYDEGNHAIYLHTARTGRTPTNVALNPQVCFHVADMGRLLPADEALEFSVEYAGVTVFGRARIVDEREDAIHGLQLLLDKYFPHLRPGRDYRPIIDEELAQTAVYRIDIDAWTGKRKLVGESFPGAFPYGEQPAE